MPGLYEAALRMYEAGVQADKISRKMCIRDRDKLLQKIRDALLAQLVEHLTLNQGVQGSSP